MAGATRPSAPAGRALLASADGAVDIERAWMAGSSPAMTEAPCGSPASCKLLPRFLRMDQRPNAVDYERFVPFEEIQRDFGERFRPFPADRVAGVVDEHQMTVGQQFFVSGGPSPAASADRACRTAPAPVLPGDASGFQSASRSGPRTREVTKRPGLRLRLPDPAPATARAVLGVCKTRRAISSGEPEGGVVPDPDGSPPVLPAPGRDPLRLPRRQPQRHLPPNDVPSRLQRSMPSARDGGGHRRGQVRDRRGAGVFGGAAEAGHFERDDAVVAGSADRGRAPGAGRRRRAGGSAEGRRPPPCSGCGSRPLRRSLR